MRTLILTDIHGNLPALRAVLASPEAKSCRAFFSRTVMRASCYWLIMMVSRRWSYTCFL